MFGLRRAPVSAEMQDWLLDGLLWCAGAGILRRDTPLVLPTSAFFPTRAGPDDQVLAEGLMGDVLRLLGLGDVAVEMAPLQRVAAQWRYDPTALGEVGGSWQSDGTGASVVHYDPEMMRARPLVFLSTLAHEAVHERLHRSTRDWPGGAEAEEPMTDLAVIAAGCGVLQLGGAEDAGWQGYLGQESRAHAMALVLGATEADAEVAGAHLPPRAGRTLRRALSHIDAADVTELATALRR
ncbi:hypothetical protein [Jannaschia marina]|uniref:hypothetical protein n=1 Tax=Jannaschia marina TaxID=2741674 RepID=UPI0015CB6D55|nr:hypothetical protein [Jannaschia marina]